MAVIGDGLSISQVAEKVGVSRQTLHAWLARYEAEGLEGLVDRSHRPVCRTCIKGWIRHRNYCGLTADRPGRPVRLPSQSVARRLRFRSADGLTCLSFC
jgi:transposase-like protein